jgi:hypothetical protein
MGATDFCSNVCMPIKQKPYLSTECKKWRLQTIKISFTEYQYTLNKFTISA